MEQRVLRRTACFPYRRNWPIQNLQRRSRLGGGAQNQGYDRIIGFFDAKLQPIAFLWDLIYFSFSSYKKGVRSMSKKNTFSFLLFNGCILANVLVGVAEAHYGFIYSSKNVAILFEANYQNKYFNTEKELKAAFTEILKMVRGEK